VHKTSSTLEPSSAPEPAQPPAGEQKPIVVDRGQMSEAPAALVSPPPKAPAAGHRVVSREEKVEYRDQDGNLLDPEQVKALEGKVSFKTRYETRTRLVDAQGNEIARPEDAGVAPPHPDVEGADRETVGMAEPERQGTPVAQKEVKADESKEQSIEKSDANAAKPASEGNEATAQ
jgi:dolichyl-phosphate-mannose-protein mannosyltransferase